MKVFCGGPWVVTGHYLGVRKWEPDFRAPSGSGSPGSRNCQGVGPASWASD